MNIFDNNKNNSSKTFLYLFFIFGFIIIFITPPFQVPDEINHFYRAWQISSGTLNPIKKCHRLGGYIPKSITKLSAEFKPFLLNPYNKMSPNYIWQRQYIQLNANDTLFKDFTNTALYSPLLYIPQALGIFLGKNIGLNPIWFIYFGRLMNLIIYTTIIYFSIRIIPFKRWLVMILACLPMSYSINSSLSADMMVNAISFFYIAYIINIAYSEKINKISNKNIAFIFILSFLIGFCKLVYTPLILLVILIPLKKFTTYKTGLTVLIIAICIGLCSSFIEKTAVDSKHISYNDYNKSFRDQSMLKKGVDIHQQIEFIKANSTTTIKVFLKSFYQEFGNMTEGYIGVLGWADVFLPPWYIYFSYIVIIAFAIFDNKRQIRMPISIKDRLYCTVIVFIVIMLIMLSQYLSWDLVGDKNVYPLQGRYFIPVFFLFFIIIISNIFIVKIKASQSKFIFTFLILFCCFSGFLSIYLIAKKSFTFNNYSSASWSVNYTFKDNYRPMSSVSDSLIIFKSDTIAIFSKPDPRFVNNEKPFDGFCSLKISNKNPYGFTLKIHNVNAGDKIIVSCRTFGTDGDLVIQESSSGLYYSTGKTRIEKDSIGWNYNEAQFIVPKTISKKPELGVYVITENDSIYIDHFKVTYFRPDKK